LYGKFGFVIHLLYQKISKFLLFEVFLDQNSSQKLYFLQMYDHNNGRTIVWVFRNFLGQNIIGRKNIFSTFLFLEM